MKKTPLLPLIALGSIGLVATSTFAATSTASSTSTLTSQHTQGKAGMIRGPHIHLTDAEKTSLNSMTDTQKQEFFDKKRTGMESKMTAQNAVIDKLLAGTALTAEEEAIRKEIITERATLKAEREAREAKMQQVRTILQKQQAGATLTSDEEAILASMSQHKPGKQAQKTTTSSSSTTTTQQ